MSDRQISHLCLELQPLAQQFLDNCKTAELDVFFTETYRSSADQDHDYEIGRTLPGHIITNARGGESPHNCTLPDGTPASKAFDFAIQDESGILDWDASDPDWQKAIGIGEALGLVSGSIWHIISDAPHFELKDWDQDENTETTTATI